MSLIGAMISRAMDDQYLLDRLRVYMDMDAEKALRGLSRCCQAKCTVKYSKEYGEGWNRPRGKLHCNKCKKRCSRYQFKGKNPHAGWNPLEDWNAWRMVEEKLLKDDNLAFEFRMKMGGIGAGFINYMESDLRTRCKTLVEILDGIDKQT